MKSPTERDTAILHLRDELKNTYGVYYGNPCSGCWDKGVRNSTELSYKGSPWHEVSVYYYVVCAECGYKRCSMNVHLARVVIEFSDLVDNKKLVSLAGDIIKDYESKVLKGRA